MSEKRSWAERVADAMARNPAKPEPHYGGVGTVTLRLFDTIGIDGVECTLVHQHTETAWEVEFHDGSDRLATLDLDPATRRPLFDGVSTVTLRIGATIKIGGDEAVLFQQHTETAWEVKFLDEHDPRSLTLDLEPVGKQEIDWPSPDV